MDSSADSTQRQNTAGPPCPICHRDTERVARNTESGLIGLLISSVFGERHYMCKECLIGFDIGWFGRCNHHLRHGRTSGQAVQSETSTLAPLAMQENFRLASIENHPRNSELRRSFEPKPAASVLELDINPVGLKFRIEIDGAKLNRSLRGAVKLSRVAAKEISKGVISLCVRMAETPPPAGLPARTPAQEKLPPRN